MLSRMVANWIQGSWVARPKPLDSPHTATRPRSLQRARPAAWGTSSRLGPSVTSPWPPRSLSRLLSSTPGPLRVTWALDRQPLGLRGPDKAGGPSWTGKQLLFGCSQAAVRSGRVLKLRGEHGHHPALIHPRCKVRKPSFIPLLLPGFPPRINTFSERGAFAGCFHFFLYSLL